MNGPDSGARLTREDVRHIAVLGRLRLTDDEADAYASQLTEILRYVEKLNELDTSGIEPTVHAQRLVNVLREDELRPSLPPGDALANAPEAEDGRFRVPPIIQEL